MTKSDTGGFDFATFAGGLIDRALIMKQVAGEQKVEIARANAAATAANNGGKIYIEGAPTNNASINPMLIIGGVLLIGGLFLAAK
jgi:hypothetical protein